ncbi:DMT family transporter [Pseudooceanicola aestuarii]|uniref:DMT family transporter n=1 Tax=Pseudooceanicola aestuarii TaxID=2697319 RepID=UPI0013D514C2|nr:DMT family transporter [Pseudooceanicola aestuarii]
MSSQTVRQATLVGVLLVLVYTALISSADAITKFIAGGYAAPQLYAISGALVSALCLLMDRAPGRQRQGMATSRPVAMAVRSGATVIAATCYFYAFRLLPFAEVFIFIGLMPVMAGLMSGPILKEKIGLPVWIALAACAIGVICLFPQGLHTITWGHAIALGATLSGTLSMVMARYISRHDTNSLAQVFYPNLAIMLVMGAILPFVYKPMPLIDMAWVGAYAGFLFSARWVLVIALRNLAAYVVTPLLNFQFVWMVIFGALFFGEWPPVQIYLGVAIVIGSGMYLVRDQLGRKSVMPRGAERPMAGLVTGDRRVVSAGE